MTHIEQDSCVPELDLSSGSLEEAFREYYPDGNSSATLMSVTDTLLYVFKESFGIIADPEPYAETFVFFDPTRGVWVRDWHALHKLFDVIKPGIGNVSSSVLRTHLTSLFEPAFREYTGNRYVVFENGVLDVATLDFWPLDSFKVRDLHLTPRYEVAAIWTPGAEELLPDFAKEWRKDHPPLG